MIRHPSSRILTAFLALLTLTAAKPAAPVPDRVWTLADLDRRRPVRIAILPVVSFIYLPKERAYVEDAWLQRVMVSRHDWLPAVLCRERMASTSRGGDSLRNAIEGQMRSRGRVDSTSSPGLARLLRSEALLCMRIDRWERIGEARSSRIYIEMTVALVDSTGRLLWRVSSEERLETVYGLPKILKAEDSPNQIADQDYDRWRAANEGAERNFSRGRPGEMGLTIASTAVAADFQAALNRIFYRWARSFPESPRRPAAPVAR